MRILLHAGVSKTGSSAIQHYLFEHRQALREAGAIYPDLGHRAHWRLIACIGGEGRQDYIGRRLARESELPSDYDVIARLRRELDGARAGDIVILSHEGFSSPGANHARLAALMREVTGRTPDFRVIAYARNPLELFVSNLQQRLKSVEKRDILPADWVSSHPKRGFALRGAFGDRLTLRAYSRPLLRDGDVISDFRLRVREAVGVDLPAPAQSIQANTSYSAAACALLALWFADGDPAARRPEFGQLKRVLQTADERAGPFPRLRLPDAWREPIAATNAADWNALVEIMDHDEAAKAGLRIDVPADAPSARPGSARRWMLDYFDPAMVEAAIALASGSASPEERLPLARKWLIGLRRRIASGEVELPPRAAA